MLPVTVQDPFIGRGTLATVLPWIRTSVEQLGDVDQRDVDRRLAADLGMLQHELSRIVTSSPWSIEMPCVWRAADVVVLDQDVRCRRAEIAGVGQRRW